MRVVSLGLVTTLLLAGCVGEGSPNLAPDGSSLDQDEGRVSLGPPRWQIGDHWQFTTSSGAQDSFIVTREAGEDWIVDTNSPGLAFFHQALEEVPTLGLVRKSDLAGSQGSDRNQFFSWPMEDGKQWTMTWDGEVFDVTAHQVSETRFRMDAAQGGQVLRTYVYDDAVRWLRALTVLDDAGETIFEVQLTGNGRNYTGQYVQWDLHAEYATTISMGEGFTDIYAVPEGTQEVWYDLNLACDPDGLEGDNGLLVLRATPQEAPMGGLDASNVCPFTHTAQGTLDPHPGNWYIQVVSFGASGHLHMVARTLQTHSL